MPDIGDRWFGVGNVGVLPCFIPDFQRDYAWGPQTGKKLVQDIIYHTYKSDLIPNDGQGSPTREYHAGHILTFTAESGSPIVDGQQRLTTLTIAACHLRDIALELEENKLAWQIDSALIWGPGAYGHSKMLFTPKDKTHVNDNMNPRKTLLNLCTLDLQFEVEVAENQTAGEGKTVPLVPFTTPWKITEGTIVKFGGDRKLKIGQQLNCGLTISSMIGDLSNNVEAGETGTIILGKKQGTTPHGSSNFHKANQALREKIQLFINTNEFDRYITNGEDEEIENPNHIPHLDSRVKRCKQLFWSLKSVSFKITNFPDEGSAVRHFLITNSASHKENLSTFDMLRARFIESRDGNEKN